jgi:hypothetical protein
MFEVLKENALPIVQKARTIGKQTPIDVVLYVKNSSQKCELKITNVTNPYNTILTQTKLKPITVDAKKYHREIVIQLLKGRYEFEYTWFKEGTLIDSSLKTIHVFVYHDSRNKYYKKVDLSAKMKVPQGCY